MALLFYMIGIAAVAAEICPESKSEYEKLIPKITDTDDAFTISTSTCPMYDIFFFLLS